MQDIILYFISGIATAQALSWLSIRAQIYHTSLVRLKKENEKTALSYKSEAENLRVFMDEKISEEIWKLIQSELFELESRRNQISALQHSLNELLKRKHEESRRVQVIGKTSNQILDEMTAFLKLAKTYERNFLLVKYNGYMFEDSKILQSKKWFEHLQSTQIQIWRDCVQNGTLPAPAPWMDETNKHFPSVTKDAV